MKSRWLFLTLVGSLVVASCGPGQVAVTAEIDVPDPETEGATITRPIPDMEIQLLPFDRDAVFDSLETAFNTPEPEIPADLLAAQQEIEAAEAEWQAAEATWGAGRDRLLALTEEMEPLSPAEGRYAVLFQEFQDWERRTAAAERTKDRAFQRFTELQEGFYQRRDSMRLILDRWADEAFADALDVFAAKAQEVGQDPVYDTTDAEGYALIDVPPGDWWVYAYYEKAYSELYWNLPITVERGDPLQVRLNAGTAVERPVF
ncbi:MAG: hypothetical protein PVJ76_01395 [Gemmatimonadota bacterium]|jgi:hypothetical protein